MADAASEPAHAAELEAPADREIDSFLHRPRGAQWDGPVIGDPAPVVLDVADDGSRPGGLFGIVDRERAGV